jgi:hypothetical protein
MSGDHRGIGRGEERTHRRDLRGVGRTPEGNAGGCRCVRLVDGRAVTLGDETPSLGEAVDALTQTGAGWLVMGKLVCMVLLGCSGAYIRTAIVDRVARQQPTPIIAWAGLELAVMAVAVSLATALGRPL